MRRRFFICLRAPTVRALVLSCFAPQAAIYTGQRSTAALERTGQYLGCITVASWSTSSREVSTDKTLLRGWQKMLMVPFTELQLVADRETPAWAVAARCL